MIGLLIISIGILLIVAGIRGEAAKVGEILKDDFTRQPSFLAWIVAVWLIGMLATFKTTRPIGQGFYALLIVVLLLANKGFFTEFKKQALN